MSESVTPSDVRVRLHACPTGKPHVGLARTALFGWALARSAGGAVSLVTHDADPAWPDLLRWLGLDWDEGPGVGGPNGPYLRSARTGLYADAARRLLESGALYESFSTPAEVRARRRAAGQDAKLGYDGFDRDSTDAWRAALRAQGREPVLRLRMPERATEWVDLVRGPVDGGVLTDPVVVRATGEPTPAFADAVDDAALGVTHVLRDEEFLASTPRRLAVAAALRGIGLGHSPLSFGHLPPVLGEGGRPLSERDPVALLARYRERGFLPEGMRDALASLGWSTPDDRDAVGAAEMIRAFTPDRIVTHPVRFAEKKAEAVNAARLRALPVAGFVARVRPFLIADGVLPAVPTDAQLALLADVAPLVRERLVVLSEASGMVRFLFAAEEDFAPEDEAAAVVGAGARPVLEASAAALEGVAHWNAAAIEEALRASLVDGLGLKPRLAYAPVRVAVTGRTVSPPLYESLELVGRDRSIGRLRRALGAI
ncbi:glutamate--tRNA ligase family protein [Actinosynnema sp. NPDC020468]|uniref:glutamate--tRNA ligase n=1 Tax=Actinosynnema sp. NPDC020468 TaxID=3154488 RepID=UPI0033DB2A8F